MTRMLRFGMISRAYWQAYKALSGSGRELESFPTLTPAEQRRILSGRLLEQIRYFGRREDALPEWRDAARISDPDELFRNWHHLPILTKTELKERYRPAEMRKRFRLKGRAGTTGGSTGEPTSYLHCSAMLRDARQRSLFGCRKLGWRPGVPLISVWGSDYDIGKRPPRSAAFKQALSGIIPINGYSLNRATVERVHAIIHRLAPVAMYGFTSMLEFVARETLSLGLEVRPGAVIAAWNGGEMLFDNQAELFRRAFSVPLLNHYGGRELSYMATQSRPDGPIEVLRPSLFLEIVDDQGKPAEPGQSGRLLWTSTVCRGTPFLRYEIGDLGSFSASDSDESGIRAIAQLHGRSAGVLRLANNMTVNCLYWNHLFKEFKTVEQFQVVVCDGKSLRLLLKGRGFEASDEQRLLSAVGKFLPEMPFEVRWVDQIPLTARGKLLQVVSEQSAL